MALSPFDARTIKLAGFTLTATGITVVGKPTFDQFLGAGDFIKRSHQACGFWLVDWITYGEGRSDWQERIDEAIDAGLLSEATVRQYRWFNRKVPKSNRLEGVDFGQHIEVAGLEPQEQKRWLQKAKDEKLSVRELRVNIRAEKRTKVVSGQAKLEGMYRVIYADPPWTYRDSGPTRDGSLGKAERHYTGMSIADLCKLPVQAHALPDSVLFLWVTAALLYENPGPREVLEAWGFRPKTGYVWDKVLGMPGSYSHVTHEHLIVATRGSCLPDVPTPQDKSVQTFRRTDEHSAKPEEFRALIQRHWTTGPYLELFGRKPVSGWSVFGNDARLWAQEAHA